MPKLLITSGPHKGRSYDVEKASIIGRGDTASIRIPDGNASREHCRVFPQAGAWVVADLNSVNGIQVNGLKTTRKNLREGDKIQIGTTILEFTGGASQRASTASGKAAAKAGIEKPAKATTDVVDPAAVRRAKRQAEFAKARQEAEQKKASSRPKRKKSGASSSTKSGGGGGVDLEVSDRVLQFNKQEDSKNPLSFDVGQYSGMAKLGIVVVALACMAGVIVIVVKTMG